MRVLALAVLAVLSCPRAGGAAYGCREVSSQVTFKGMSVTPQSPVVGDHVELHFDVDYLVYSVTALRLNGASPRLDGDVYLPMSHDATFELSAVQAGTATVQLAVTYGTEEQCDDGNGYTYFQEGPDHTVVSPSYQIEIGAAAACPGDCEGDRQVTIGDLVRGASIALGNTPLDSCPSFDVDGSGSVTIDELLAAVNAALLGCGA
jgi:hypothetical protein